MLMVFMTLIMVLARAACGGGSSEEESDEGSGESGGEEGSEGGGDSASGEDLYNYEDYNTVVANDAEPTGEGTLKVGLTSDTPFEGKLNFNLYQGNPDLEVISLFDEPLFTMEEHFQYTNDGAMQYEVNEEDSTITFTLLEGITWHDGEGMTI